MQKICAYLFAATAFIQSNNLEAADFGTIVIYRPSAFNSWARNILVSIDGNAIATLKNCTYVKIKAAQGTHQIEIALKPWPGEGNKEPARLPVFSAANLTSYVGFHPNEMTEEEIKINFSTHEKHFDQKGKLRFYTGVARGKEATKHIADCNRVESLFD